MVIKCIAENSLIFVMDPYANYVVQFVLNLRIPEINQTISEKLMSNFINLSK